jgi:hypothetical protein
MAGTRRRWNDTEDGFFARQVADVMVNGIAAFRDKSLVGRIDGLYQLARRLRSDLSPSNAVPLLDALFASAVEALDLPFERAAARHALGMRGSASFGKDLETRQKAAAGEYESNGGKEISGLTFRQDPRYERTIIVDLGRVLEGLDEGWQRHYASTAENACVSPHDWSYVNRERLECEAIALLDAASAVALIGLPGTGKTRLAEYLVQQSPAAGSTKWVTGSTERTEIDSLTVALANTDYGQLGQADGYAVRRAFRAYTRSGQAPRYIVIDDIRSRESVESLIDEAYGGTVLITTQRDYWCDRPGAPSFLRVGSMESLLETASLLKKVCEAHGYDLAPKVQERNDALRLRDLIMATGGIPKVIVQIASYLAEAPGADLLELARELRQTPLNVLDVDSRQGSEALVIVFKKVLAELETNPPALGLLELMVSYQEFGDEREFAARLRRHLRTAISSDDLMLAIVRKSWRTLCSYSLDESPHPQFSHSSSSLRMDGLAAVILGDLLTEEKKRTTRRGIFDSSLERLHEKMLHSSAPGKPFLIDSNIFILSAPFPEFDAIWDLAEDFAPPGVNGHPYYDAINYVNETFVSRYGARLKLEAYAGSNFGPPDLPMLPDGRIDPRAYPDGEIVF